VVAAVSVTGSTRLINADTVERIASQVKQTALGISRQLGYTGAEAAGDARPRSHDAA
jgi:hypothetical protein